MIAPLVFAAHLISLLGACLSPKKARLPAVNLSDFDALRKAKHECLLSGGLCCTWCRWQQPLAPGGAVRDEGLYFLRSRFSSGPTKALFADCVLLRAHRGERAC